METKHTPGPWEVAGRYIRTHFDGKTGGIMVADVSFGIHPDEEHDANALLISTAPDLLAFAKAFTAHIDRSDTDDIDFGHGLANSGLIERARDLVTRAEVR